MIKVTDFRGFFLLSGLLSVLTLLGPCERQTDLGSNMIDADKKFHGGQRYYHHHEEATDTIGANPSWEERQAMFRRERRNRILRFLFIGVGMIGMIVGTIYVATL